MTAKHAVLKSVTPLIPTVGSVQDAIDYYTQQLGFSALWQSKNGAEIQRDGISFHLVENSNRVWADNSSYIIGVSDLDALYDEFRNVRGHVGQLETKAWGRREFHMIVPSGVCFQFYQVP